MESATKQVLSSASSRAEIARIASRHGARNIRVFGSAGRGDIEARDLDLLVKMAAGRSLLDLVALSNELQDALGIDVDVVSEDGLSPYLRERILAEAVPI
jgi:predicted nucleotidyltransferase